MRRAERFDCPACSMAFESEDGDEVVRKVMEHMKLNHPEWGTEGSSRKPVTRSKPSLSGLWKRGRS
jgi:hypothetical protein